MKRDKVNYSVVVPFHNEEDNIPILYKKIVAVMQGRYEPFEMVFVDDSSTDSSYDILLDIALNDERVVLVKLKRNYGQTAALAAGFDHAEGDIIISMDGDLQHDPQDIPLLVEKLFDGNYDIVSGWRKKRVDNLLLRRIPSRVANWMMAKLSGVELHDFGTTFKVYRKSTIKQINLYGEMHRFIPALASWNGARITEVPIKNVGREAGKSHYGISRTFRVMFDLLTVRFLLKYVTRPLHFFGPIGLVTISLSVLLGLFLLLCKLLSVDLFVEHGPLLILAAMMFLAGIQLICTGLVAELLARTYFESQNRNIYTVERLVIKAADVPIGKEG
ncbi:MAG: glycosyltransferase family 2 protein [Acidobacteriota bacterium]|nr:glycosyltransferase family 2 protein [Blastocatellia bacterium]MDW8412349.1 glycosyltransferase family 2 protein [Acidobacteriota bacterium]